MFVETIIGKVYPKRSSSHHPAECEAINLLYIRVGMDNIWQITRFIAIIGRIYKLSTSTSEVPHLTAIFIHFIYGSLETSSDENDRSIV